MNRAQFIKQYRKLTPIQRKKTCCFVHIPITDKDGKTMYNHKEVSWNVVYVEVNARSEGSKQLLDAIDEHQDLLKKGLRFENDSSGEQRQ